MELTIKSTDSISECNDEFDVNRIKTEPSHQFDEDNDDWCIEGEEVDVMQMNVTVKEDPEIHIVDIEPNFEARNFDQSVKISPHKKSKRFECKYCDMKFKHRYEVTEHERIHTGEKSFACDKCPMRCTSRSNFKRHMLTHSTVKQFECEVCSKRFTSKTGVNEHMKCVHSDATPFSCQFCSKSFKLKRYLLLHTKTQHKSENECCADEMPAMVFACDECQMEFASIASLNVHRQYHLRETRFRCNICAIGFSIRYQYIEHMNSHEPGLFQCKQCPMRFFRKNEFRLYVKSHRNSESTSDGLFMCDLCQNSYLSKNGLIYHMRSHSGDAYTECKICVKKFQKNYIKRHMKIHKDRTLKCKLCSKEFKHHSKLELHKKLHLNEDFLKAEAQIGSLDDDEDLVKVVEEELI